MGFPALHSTPVATGAGTPYLTEPGVVVLSVPDVNLSDIRHFLKGFGELGFVEYLDDPTDLPPAEKLVKFAGQLCYMSFGPKRTLNADTSRYLGNIMSSGHGSVLEHANVSMLFYGISRSVTHELVRHRAGFAYSQLSQRYVSGRVLRFVERPEYRGDPELHARFERRIDLLAKEYDEVATVLLARQKLGSELLSAEQKMDERKKVNQAARSALPNEAEAPIVVTANVRAWRHFCEMRANEHAEIEIRALAFKAFLCLRVVTPMLFDDYQIVTLPDGTKAVKTEFRKV